jgi:hypothetical protein
VKVKPKPGLVVRDPDTRQPLPSAGAEVPDTVHWRRRLAAGDVVRLESSPAVREVSP